MNTNNNPFDQQKSIPNVKHIIAVSSGKGGVGKSTVSTHLALAMAKTHKVGILDADIYGPSVPRMLGCLHQRPEITAEQRLIPIERYKLKIMSIGFLVDEGAAVVWRGPMLFKAMNQFLWDVEWGELDFLIIDLPPGTGDVQLTLAQKVPLSGAVIVSTPQNISLIDVKKAVDMFQRVQVPILGVIENMSYFLNPATNEKTQLFPKGDLDSYIQKNNFQKLGEIPFNPSIGMASEAGIPITESSSSSAEAKEFFQIAKKVIRLLW